MTRNVSQQTNFVVISRSVHAITVRDVRLNFDYRFRIKPTKLAREDGIDPVSDGADVATFSAAADFARMAAGRLGLLPDASHALVLVDCVKVGERAPPRTRRRLARSLGIPPKKL